MRYCGKLGFADEVEETAPSVFTEKMTERTYYGDVLEFGRQMQMGDKVNPRHHGWKPVERSGGPVCKRPSLRSPVCGVHGTEMAGDQREGAIPAPDPDFGRALEWKHG